MLAVDCHGNFFPCIRFYDISLTNKNGFKIGDIYNGINMNRLRPFQSLTLKNQSTEECINCEIAGDAHGVAAVIMILLILIQSFRGRHISARCIRQT